MSAPIDNAPVAQQPFSPDPMGFGDDAQQQADAAASQNGVATTTTVRNSYWGTDVVFRFYLPGEEALPESERQFIEYKKMNEGERSKYQKMISDPVLVHRGSGDARMKVDPARDREALITSAVCGWNLWKGDRPATFNAAQLELWRKASDPSIIDKLEKAIRKANPWLRNEMSLKDAEEELERIQQTIAELREEEEEKENSSNK